MLQKNSFKIGKIRTAAVAFILFATVGISFFSQVATAQTITNNYHQWPGYNGNNSIYLSTAIASDPYLPPVISGANSYLGHNGYFYPNTVMVGLASKLTSSSGSLSYLYSENYQSSNKAMLVDIPIVAVGASNNSWATYDQYAAGVNGLTIAYNVSVPGSNSNLFTQYNGGLNVTGTYYGGYVYSKALNQTLEYLMSSIPYVGIVIGAGQLFGQYMGDSKVENVIDVGGIGPIGNISETYGVVNGTIVSNGNGYNNFGGYKFIELQVPSIDFNDTGLINLYGANRVIGDGPTGPVYGTGAVSRLQLNTVPAYSIGGTVYVNDQPQANKQVEISTQYYYPSLGEYVNDNYFVETNSSGQYRFFGQPGQDYTVQVPGSDSGIQSVNVALGNVGGNNSVNFYTSTVTFQESGLHGQTWSVTLNGYEQSTSGSQIQFTEPPGTYSFTIGNVQYYSSNPSSSSFNLGTSPKAISISFSPTQYWAITFDESGLPSGQQWNVKVDGVQKSSTGTSISFSEPAGNNPWSTPYVYYSTTLWYEPSPGNGNFVPPGSQTVSVQFYGVQQSPGSCVYKNAPILMGNGTSIHAKNVAPGDLIMTYNMSTSKMQVGTVLEVFISQHTSMVVVNGYLQLAGDQDVLTNHGYIQAQNLTSNDSLYNVNSGKYLRVHSVVTEHGSYTMYDFFVSGNHDYIAWTNLMNDRLP